MYITNSCLKKPAADERFVLVPEEPAHRTVQVDRRADLCELKAVAEGVRAGADDVPVVGVEHEIDVVVDGEQLAAVRQLIKAPHGKRKRYIVRAVGEHRNAAEHVC